MFVIEVPCFSLDKIYESRQAPRWIKLKESKYIIIHKDKALKIEQQKSRLIMSCSEQEFYDTWFEYFDLKTDYFDENYKIEKLGGKFKIPARRGNGIHILNQDEFEVFIYSKIVAYAGYKKAQVAMNHIAEICGIKHVQSMREAGRITWYEWPDALVMYENIDKLKKMGKINAWLDYLCTNIIYYGFDFEQHGNILYSLLAEHNINAFPTYEIEDAIEKNFKCDIKSFEEKYLSKVKNKGLVYMYILHHIINKPKEKR